MGEELFREGRFSEALEQFRRESNLRMMACTLEAMGQLEAAEDLYRQAIEKSSWDARTHLALATFHARGERWEQAAEVALEGARCPYATPQVHYDLGVARATAQMKLGRLPEAMETLEGMSRNGADPIDLAWLRSKLMLMLGRRAEAQQLIDQVYASVAREVQRDPTLSARWTLLGDCCYAKGDQEAAHRAYDRALQCSTVDWAACRGLGILAEKRGEVEQARGFYAKFLQLDPLNLSGPIIRQRMQALAKGAPPTAVPSPQPGTA